jgi:hypothetical protein
MLALPSIVLGVTILTFVSVVLLVAKEQSVGRRLLLVTFRGWIDRLGVNIASWLWRVLHMIVITFVYIVHQIRAGLAAVIAPRPRQRKQRDKVQYERTDSHLSQMHDHKADTALSKSQKKKLRHKKLEERF